jgi:hypothetical protein
VTHDCWDAYWDFLCASLKSALSIDSAGERRKRVERNSGRTEFQPVSPTSRGETGTVGTSKSLLDAPCPKIASLQVNPTNPL